MNQLIQLIGPQDCGKTELRKRLCPGAVDIGRSLQSAFNKEMVQGYQFYFEYNLTEKGLQKLKKFLESDGITVEQMRVEPVHRKGNFTFIYCGQEALNLPGMIWSVNREVNTYKENHA